MYHENECYLMIRLDLETIRMLQLEVTAQEVVKAIESAPKLKLKIKVRAWSTHTGAHAQRPTRRGERACGERACRR